MSTKSNKYNCPEYSIIFGTILMKGKSMTYLLMYNETVLSVLKDKTVTNLEEAEHYFAANYFATMLAHNHSELKSEDLDEETKESYHENCRFLIRSYNLLSAKDFLNQYNLQVVEDGDI